MKKMILLSAFVFLVSSCTHVISRPVREQARTDIPFSSIKGNVDKYRAQYSCSAALSHQQKIQRKAL